MNNSQAGSAREALLNSFVRFVDSEMRRTQEQEEEEELPRTPEELRTPGAWADRLIFSPLVGAEAAARTLLPSVRVCPGCAEFSCVRAWRNFNMIPQGKRAESWMKNHGLLKAPSCTVHGPSMMRDIPGRPNIQMCCFHEFQRNPCRMKRGKLEPYVSGRMDIDAGKLLRIWADIADNLTAGQIARNRSIRHKVVTKILHDLGNAALHQEENAVYAFSSLQVDETFVGKRKYHRGRRPRNVGHWFVSITEVKGRRMGRTHWKLVKRRDHETLKNFILPHLESARSLVVTDAWRGYLGMEEFCRHFAVNHSREFVELHGYHTNHAECVHRIIKDWTKRQHYNFGASAQDLKRNIALQCVKFGSVHNDPERAKLPMRWACQKKKCVLGALKGYTFFF